MAGFVKVLVNVCGMTDSLSPAEGRTRGLGPCHGTQDEGL